MHWIDFDFDLELLSLDTFENKLEHLFSLKDKWTYTELEQLLGDYVDTDLKLPVLLQKQTRQIKEPCAFSKWTKGERLTTYFIKKF